MRVGQISTREVVVVQASEPVVEAARLLSRNNVGCLIVVHPAGDEESANVPVGIVTDRDIVLRAVAQHPNRIESRAVADVMSRDLLIAYENEDLYEVLKRMRQRGVRRVPVVDDDGKLLGILACDDIVDWLSEELSDLTRLIANEQRPKQGASALAESPERSVPR